MSHRLDCGMLVQVVADSDYRRTMAPAHARGAHDPDPVAEPRAQIGEQLLCAGEFTTQAVAYSNRELGRWRFAIHDDVEMSVERGDLVHLDEREPHLLGERREVARVEAAEMVLQQMQVLDQQVAAPLTLAEQRLHLGES